MQEMRDTCYECRRPKAVCICSTIENVDNQSHVVILQHPSESRHPLGSAKIAQLCLNRITLLKGESFTLDKKLNYILENENCYLLYPYENAQELSDKLCTSQDKITFIILDGTWKKARKIYHSSENLRSLPLLKFSQADKSDYRIRKQPTELGLSTIETVIKCLSIIEPDLNTNALAVTFKSMIDKQIELMGNETYQNNYNKNEES